MGARAARTRLVKETIRPASGDRILDIGCGTAEILDYLPVTVKYTGFDISPQYIKSANRHRSERGSFICGLVDEQQLLAMPPFQIVLALGVLHHLDDDEARQLFTLARVALREGGRVVTLDPCYAPDQHWLSRFLVSRDRGCNVRDEKSYLPLSGNHFTRVQGEVRHQKWIPYTHWIMECSV